MKSLTDCYKLANGVEIPCIGFGTWQTPDGDVCVSSVKAAIAAGYRHIDTAEMYENEDRQSHKGMWCQPGGTLRYLEVKQHRTRLRKDHGGV